MDGWIDDDCLEEGPPDRDPLAGVAVDAVAKVIREAARAAVAVAGSSHTAVGVGVGVGYSVENDGVEGGDTVDVAAVGIIDLVADVPESGGGGVAGYRSDLVIRAYAPNRLRSVSGLLNNNMWACSSCNTQSTHPVDYMPTRDLGHAGVLLVPRGY